MLVKRQMLPEKRRFPCVLEPVPSAVGALCSDSHPGAYSGQDAYTGRLVPTALAFAQNTRDEVRLVNGDGQLGGALAAQPGMKQTPYVAQSAALEPITLAIRGRGDHRALEYRQDGTANALFLPNGGRDGIGVGAIAQPIAFHPTQDPSSAQDGTSHAITNGSSRGQATVAVCATGEVTHALTCTASHGATEDGSGRGVPLVEHPVQLQVRRLTPTECEALQAFPRDWTAEVRLADSTIKQQADGPRYKQLGNAVTVNVAEWIARRVRAALESGAGG